MNELSNRRLLLFFVTFCTLFSSLVVVAEDDYDVVIYGGTSAGIVAGIQVKALGKSVIVIEPTDREGGLTTGGLGQTDIGLSLIHI